jgi:hypothetical protein
LTSFKWEIKESFEEELEKQPFKIYRLPHDFISVDQRSRIDTSAQFDDYLKECLNNFENPPYLYIFNSVNNSSPSKVPCTEEPPMKVFRADGTDESDVTSNSSRNSESSERCRERDREMCVFCSYQDSSAREACHIFEIKSFNKIRKK